VPATAQLSQISAELQREIIEIQQTFDNCAHHMDVSGYVQYGVAEDGCVVSIWDAWNRFMRNLYLTSCAGTGVGVSGVLYTPSQVRNESAAIQHLRQNCRNTKVRFTRSEPNWYAPNASFDYVKILGLANGSAITAALSNSSIQTGTVSISNPLGDLRRLRNFVAHKNWETHSDVTRFMGAYTSHRPYLRSNTTGGSTKFLDWCEAIVAIAEAACA